jgi:hypothetical protein
VTIRFLAFLALLRLGWAAGPIQFEDATAKSGIRFTHSIGAEKLGSLLESAGAGCVWFDYNRDGKPDLFVASGRPMGAEMHPIRFASLPPKCRTITCTATTATAPSPM